jgi:predicted GNAT family N-acyltransferase
LKIYLQNKNIGFIEYKIYNCIFKKYYNIPEDCNKKVLYITRIIINKQFRGNGYAKQLLHKCKMLAGEKQLLICLDAIPLDDLTDQEKLCSLYEHMNFIKGLDNAFVYGI